MTKWWGLSGDMLVSQLRFLQTVWHIDVSAVTLLTQAAACSLTRAEKTAC